MLGEDTQTRIRRIAVAAILLAFTAFVLVAMLFRDSLIGQLFFRLTADVFMDYFNCLLVVANRTPYDGFVTMYPPLAELIFYLFSRTITYDMLFDTPPLRLEQFPMMSFMLYIAIPVIITIWAIADYLKISKPMNRFVILAFFASTPFIWTLERGNIIIYAFAGAMVFICYYDSDKKWLRELALMGLAFSAGIKLYPAILGIILIRDKRWKEAIRCAVYGFIAVFAPFAVFGGYNSFLSMLNSLRHNMNVFSNIGYSNKVNFANTFNVIGTIWFKRPEAFGWAQKLAYVLTALLIVAAFLVGKRWKSVLFLTLALIGGPAFSHIYCLTFMLVPFLMFIAGKEKEYKKTDVIYLLTFIAILAPIPITIGEVVTTDDVNLNTQIMAISMLIMTFWGYADAAVDTFVRLKAKREVKA